MQGPERPITGFRRRLWQLIDERCEGKYTRLARRAGIPISTMEHYVHLAVRLPGGEPLLRMAEALGVSVHFLVAGEETARPADGPPRDIRVVPRTDEAQTRTHLTLPMLGCTCPDICLLTQPMPPALVTGSTVVVERDLVAHWGQHHLIAVCVTPTCPSPEWPEGTRLVVAWHTRPRQWEDLTLLHAEHHCAWGHLTQVGDALLFSAAAEGEFRVIPAGVWTILGTVVAAVAPL